MTEDEMKARIEELENEKTRLLAKNDELIGKSKKAREEADNAKTLAETAQEERDRKAGDIEALEKRLNDKYAKQIADIASERDSARKSFQDSQVKTAIQTAFAQHNVLPDAHDIIDTYFSTRVQHADGVATVDGKPISDALADYFKSDKAKPFIAASANSGVGPKLGAGKSTPSPTDTFSIDGFAKLMKTDPAAAASWAEASGNGYLNNL